MEENEAANRVGGGGGGGWGWHAKRAWGHPLVGILFCKTQNKINLKINFCKTFLRPVFVNRLLVGSSLLTLLFVLGI